VAGLALCAILGYGQVDPRSPMAAGWDLHGYLAMAAAVPGLARGVPAPFAYRLLGPYLAGLLPLAGPVAFRLLSLAVGTLLAVALFGYLRSEGIGRRAAAWTAVLFTLNWPLFGCLVWNPFQLDDLLVLPAYLTMLWALPRRRWGVFALALLAGALARETALLLVPVSLAFLRESRQFREEKGRWAVAVLPGIAAFVLVRLLVPVAPGPGGAGAGGLAYYPGALARHTVYATYAEVWAGRLVWSFVPLLTLPLVFGKTTRELFAGDKWRLLLFALVAASTVWARDPDRLMAPVFSIFFWLVAAIVDRHLACSRAPLALLATGALLAYSTHLLGRSPLPSAPIPLAANLLAVILVAAGAYVRRIAERRQRLAVDP
jgi:hypothetical protein